MRGWKAAHCLHSPAPQAAGKDGAGTEQAGERAKGTAERSRKEGEGELGAAETRTWMKRWVRGTSLHACGEEGPVGPHHHDCCLAAGLAGCEAGWLASHATWAAWPSCLPACLAAWLRGRPLLLSGRLMRRGP